MARDSRRGRAHALAAILLAAISLATTLGAALWPLAPERGIDPAHAALLPPGARLQLLELVDGRRLAADPIERRGDRYRLGTGAQERWIDAGRVAPGRPVRTIRFWLGTDRFGRDLAARLLYGGRLSLEVAFASVALALLLGVPIGLATGMARRGAATLAVAGLDAAQAFPRLFLVVALAALIRPGATSAVLILGLSGWMPIARLVRADTRRLAAAEFVVAARAAGVGPVRIAWRHLLPNLAPVIASQASLAIAGAVAAEAALSFLGLGVPPPAPSWGNLIADGRDLLATAPWLSLAPGLALAVTVFAANLLAEAAAETSGSAA